jgi:hypothetical protein
MPKPLPSDMAFLPQSASPQAHKVNCQYRTSDGIMACDCSRGTPAFGESTKRFDRGQPTDTVGALKLKAITALQEWATEVSAGMSRGLGASTNTSQPKGHAQHLINVLNLMEDIKGVKVE